LEEVSTASFQGGVVVLWETILKGDNIERDDSMRYDINDRTMFLILCEAGVRHYEGRGPKWVEITEDMTPGNYIWLSWNFDHLFTTADGKLIQLKVVDARPEAAQSRPAFPWAAVNSQRRLAMLESLTGLY